jgi:hypothetical protein
MRIGAARVRDGIQQVGDLDGVIDRLLVRAFGHHGTLLDASGEL